MQTQDMRQCSQNDAGGHNLVGASSRKFIRASIDTSMSINQRSSEMHRHLANASHRTSLGLTLFCLDPVSLAVESVQDRLQASKLPDEHTVLICSGKIRFRPPISHALLHMHHHKSRALVAECKQKGLCGVQVRCCCRVGMPAAFVCTTIKNLASA